MGSNKLKPINEIIQEMGFNKSSPQSVQEAFIKNLIKAAYGVDVETPNEKQSLTRETKDSAQLSFDFGENAEVKKRVS
jgi:hypothetical protein